MTTLSSDRIVDIRTLPGTRETTAYQDGGLFPILALAPNGDVVAALRGGAGHLGREGRMEVVRSSDCGLTWTPPNLIADSDDDDRDAAFGVSSQGTLVLLYQREHKYDADGNYQGGLRISDPKPIALMATRSFDNGLTWEEPYPLSFDSLATASFYGKIVSLDDGTLLAPIYNSRSWADEQSEQMFDTSYLVRSQDDGRTWGGVSQIAPHRNETALIVLSEGDLLAVQRDDTAQALHSTRSQDGGLTWSSTTQITQARQHPADLVHLSNGDILLTYGNRNPPYRIEGRISRDGGRSWLNCLLTFSGHLYGYTAEETRRTDLGYPSSVVRDGSQGITMYYYNPSMRLAVDARQRDSNPLYRHMDYCAVAVTWQEDELIAAVENTISGQ
jgi:hypothetical protein